MKPTPKIHSGHCEVAVADLIGWREHVIVPNVSWGLGLAHECDILVLDEKNRFTEIEIKISKPDLRRDFQKPHGHDSRIISRLVYAVAEPVLALALEIVPPQFGVIAVAWDEREQKFAARWVRRCRHRAGVTAQPHHIRKFMALGCMRIWSLKKTLNRKTGKGYV